MNRFRKKYLQENPQQETPDTQEKSDQLEQADPLRDFKELSEREQQLKKKQRLRERRRRFLLYAALFLVIVFAWSYIALNFYGQDEDSNETTERFALDDSLSAPELFQAFIRANFGKQSPEQLNTIKVSGVIQMDDVEQEFVLYKKQPSMALLVLTYGEGGDITFGMDGEEVWQKIETDDGSIQVGRVTGETAEQIKETGNFFTPFVRYVLNYNGLDPAFEINDRREESGLIEVNFTNPRSGQKSLAKIDGQNLQVQKLENTDQNGKVSTVIYRDYEVVNGFQVPRNIEHLSGGEVTQSIRIHKAATNTGILSEIFKTPRDLGSGAPAAPTPPSPKAASPES